MLWSLLPWVLPYLPLGNDNAVVRRDGKRDEDEANTPQYLVGLAGLLGGYAWFLAHNREASYRSAMNLTHSRRQQQLYDSKGFDLPRYQYLVEEGNALRKEIMAVASEYDVEWDEKRDARDERVVDALKEDRQERKRGGKKRGGEEEDDD